MTTLLINSVYRATEGEGIHIGIPQVFVRFQGCHIGCVNCDSKETWDFAPEFTVSMLNVLERVETESQGFIKRVSITGGDPLHPSHIPSLLELIEQLKLRGYYINIEAAGTRIVKEVFDAVDFISYDFKTPSTTVKTSKELLLKFLQDYGAKAQIKAVVADKKDFEATFDAYHFVKTNGAPETPWCLTPCYEPDEVFPMARFQDVIRMNESFGHPFRVIGQQHKWAFGPGVRLV